MADPHLNPLPRDPICNPSPRPNPSTSKSPNPRSAPTPPQNQIPPKPNSNQPPSTIPPPSQHLIPDQGASASQASTRTASIGIDHKRPSYAQIIRDPKGPGFVKSHAVEWASFGKLPRTGIVPRVGTKNGKPSIGINFSDLLTIEALYAKAIVLKFHSGRPTLDECFAAINAWGMSKPFTMGLMDSRTLLLRFQAEEYMLIALSQSYPLIKNHPFKVFRWHNLCHKKEDACRVPVWLSLPKLPMQCFIPEYLEAVANKIGTFLCFDKPTVALARPSLARMCVEIDLRKPPPTGFWVDIYAVYWQPILYERLPQYCLHCHSQGHNTIACKRKASDANLADEVVPDVNFDALRARQHSQDNLGVNSSHVIPVDVELPLITSTSGVCSFVNAKSIDTADPIPADMLFPEVAPPIRNVPPPPPAPSIVARQPLFACSQGGCHNAPSDATLPPPIQAPPVVTVAPEIFIGSSSAAPKTPARDPSNDKGNRSAIENNKKDKKKVNLVISEPPAVVPIVG